MMREGGNSLEEREGRELTWLYECWVNVGACSDCDAGNPFPKVWEKDGTVEERFTHLLCSRVASAFFFVLFGVVNLQRAHIEFSRSKSKQAFKRQKGKRKRGQRSAEVSVKVVQTAWLRVDICGHLWTFSSLTATVGLVWWEAVCKSVEVEDLIRYWSRLN